MKFTTIALFSTVFAAVITSSSPSSAAIATASADSADASIFTPEEVKSLADLHGKTVDETIAHFGLQAAYVYEASDDSTDSSIPLGKRSFYYNQLSRWGRMRW